MVDAVGAVIDTMQKVDGMYITSSTDAIHDVLVWLSYGPRS